LKLADGDPAKAQLYSAVVGAVVNSALDESMVAGSSIAQYGTKYNLFAWTKPFLAPKLKTNFNREVLANNQAYVISISVGEGIGGKVGLILDKFGNVYEVIGGQTGVSLLPADASVGICTIAMPGGKNVTSEEMKDILNGFTLGVNAEGGFGGGFSISLTLDPKVSAEANASTNVGIGVEVTHTEYIYNIND
jgi:hypothetical protein